jgi:hypothetical protein
MLVRSIKRDEKTGKMLKIVFCNEGPEVRVLARSGRVLQLTNFGFLKYFEYLAQVQPDTLVSLYQQLNPGVTITKADLFINQGSRLAYNPTNKWNAFTNTGTIMHL